MKITNYESQEAWLEARRGKITGSVLKGIVDKTGVPKDAIVAELEKAGVEFKKSARKEDLLAMLPQGAQDALKARVREKIGFYELVAARLGLPPDEGENAMERGHILEPEALDRFEAATGKKVVRDLSIWSREDDDSIAVSPDGWVGKGASEAVEVKCLSSARHIQAVVENRIPDDYEYQVLQYFCVNDRLKTLHFVFYDPRLRVKDLHIIEVKREDVAGEVEGMVAYQREKLKKVDDIVTELTKF